MMIKYTTGKYIYENKNIEIEDTKNVFLRGKNPYDALDTYLGIFTKKDCIVIINIISYRNIYYKRYINKSIPTECDIEKYLQNNNNVEVISKETFKSQIDFIKKEILEM